MYIWSGKLMLRNFLVSDTEQFYSVAHDPGVKRYVPYCYPHTLDEAAELIDNYSKVDFINDFYFAICNAETKQMVGVIMAYRNSSLTLEVCAFIGEKWRGLGYCTEATKVVMRYLATSTNYTALNFAVKRSNKASRHVLEELGARQVGPEYYVYILQK